MTLVKATIEGIRNYDYEQLETEFCAMLTNVKEAGIHVTLDVSHETCVKNGKKFVANVLTNMETRFSDDISNLSSLHKALKEKSESPSEVLRSMATLFSLSPSEILAEWTIFRRIADDLSLQDVMIDIATSSHHQAMFPVISRAIRILLLLPLGTATVERSFSALNRILCSERCRLSPEHVRELMLLSIEGPRPADVREVADDDDETCKLVESAYKFWLRKPRRGC